ncbi:MAG TPA: AI-2E family transporter [Candidatus Saccharimonadales bacterium]|nr:AI-2E family transporter [Candidatus Saccharimonadales bacterium]
MFGFFHRNKEDQVWVNISNRTVIRVLVLVALAIVGLAALRKAEHSLVLIFTASFLALALNTPVHWLAQKLPGKRKGSRVIATTISALIVIIILGAFFASITPPLVRQTNNFIDAIPHIIRETHNQKSTLGKIVHRYHLSNQVTNFSNEVKSHLHNLSGDAVSTVGRLTTSVFSVLAILVLTFMMLVEGPRWLKKIHKEFVPTEYSERATKIASEMHDVIRGFVNGQVLLASIAALLITPMLFILHISYPLALAVIIFICGLIPMVGHTLGAIIISIVALFHSPVAALIILIYYILYQQIETYIIQPRIQANSTKLTPLLVFAAVVIGVSFNGLLGGLVAIPLAGCLRVLVVNYLDARNNNLGKAN